MNRTRAQRRRFPGHADQVRAARRFVAGALGERCPRRDDAVLAVSEIVTNAVEHTASGVGTGSFEVNLTSRGSVLRVEVHDDGSAQRPHPGPGPLDGCGESGRGLALVEMVVDRWGESGGRTGRTVWFELDWPAEPERAVTVAEPLSGALAG